MPYNNPPNAAPNLPDEPDSDPGFSDSSLLDSSDQSDNDYYERRQRTKKNKINAVRKLVPITLSKIVQSLHPTYLHLCINHRS